MNFKDWIVTETRDWMVINKPAGLVVERNRYESNTIEDLVHIYLSSTTKKPYVGIVHRLDRVTSGALLLAKKKSCLKQLNKQFEEKQVQKTYLAVVEQQPIPATGHLVHFLVKDQLAKKAVISEKAVPNSKSCALDYQYVQPMQHGYLLDLQPKTGRFHQIRAQLAFIDCPIVGDEKYGGKKWIDRQIGLHASSLQFLNPSDGNVVKLEVAMPDSIYWATQTEKIPPTTAEGIT